MSAYVGPEQWAALAETSPAERDAWVARLGGSGAASVAVSGAINRGRLVLGVDGLYRLAERRPRPVQLALDLGGQHAGLG